MDIKEEIVTEAFLARAAPEVVYEWLKAWPRRSADEVFYWNDIPRPVELCLLERRNDIVDLALAAWATQSETLAALYERWCARSTHSVWPPTRPSMGNAVLVAILGNDNCAGVLFGLVQSPDVRDMIVADLTFYSEARAITGGPPSGLTDEEFNWLIEHGDDDLLSIVHGNIGPAPGLLESVSARKGAYGRIDDRRWLKILSMIGHNARFRRTDQSDYDGPDTLHWDTHQALVNAATICPKTAEGAEELWGIFIDMPTKATKGAAVSDELAAALAAWGDNVSVGDSGSSLELAKFDGMTHSERVRFHLLRHYCICTDLDPDDPDRVRRLAAYATCPVSEGKCLKAGQFAQYAERDGPAFAYATSLNPGIWLDPATRNAMLQGKFPMPDETDGIYRNRAACAADFGTPEQSTVQREAESQALAIARMHKSIEGMTETLDVVRQEVVARIAWLKRLVILALVVLVVSVLFSQ